MGDVLDAVPGSRPFGRLPDGTLLALTADASQALLRSGTAVAAFDGARRPNTRADTAARSLRRKDIDVDAGRQVLLAGLRDELDQLVPAPGEDVLVDTLDLLQRPIALSTIAALVPGAGEAARREIAGSVLSWLDSLAVLITQARPPRRWAASTRRERDDRSRVTRLLTATGPVAPPALALAGGVQVPTAAAAWLLDLLSRHPEALRAVADGEPSWADAVVWETLRLYPPTWALLRLIIEDTEIAGARLRLASRVVVSPLALGRDQRLYPHADALGPGFAPRRWLDGTRPGDWLPFGAGPHSCPGRALALVQLRAIAEFLAGAVTMAPLADVTGIDAANGLKPDPCRLWMRRRQSA